MGTEEMIEDAVAAFTGLPVEEVPCVQGTTEWHHARAGYITSTGADAVLPLKDLGTKGGRDNESTRLRYLRNVAYARVSLDAYDPSGFNQTPAMERGIALEPEACDAYAAYAGVMVEPVGFLRKGAYVGDSPDRVVRDDAGRMVGCVEVKVPLLDAHAEYREVSKEGRVPQAYLRQVLHHLTVTGADWCDFVSYHPGCAGRLRLAVVRLTRAEAQPWLDIYVSRLIEFVQDVAAFEARLREDL